MQIYLITCECNCGTLIPSHDSRNRPRHYIMGHAARRDAARLKVSIARKGDPVKRFWEKIIKTTTCWLWNGNKRPRGYGAFRFRGKMMQAHRVSWELHNGPIPEGLHICHHCDNPPCVRPDHLFLGTDQDNMQDMLKKGRGKFFPGSLNGQAKLSYAQVAEIRQRFFAGETQTKLAHEFGIHQGTVSRYILNHSYRQTP